MVEVFYDEKFERFFNKFKDASFRDQIKKLIRKIIENPEIGKPMKFERKGTREVYAGSYHLAYAFLKEENKLVFLEIYHKDEQ